MSSLKYIQMKEMKKWQQEWEYSGGGEWGDAPHPWISKFLYILQIGLHPQKGLTIFIFSTFQAFKSRDEIFSQTNLAV